MLCSEHTQSLYESDETDSLDNTEACVEISMRRSWIWSEICFRCRHEIAGICRCRLGRERSGSEENRLSREHSGTEEHLRLLFYFGICHGFMVQ
jgi:hypothetical protein